jgi:8-oxo-dGTP diphosphatase
MSEESKQWVAVTVLVVRGASVLAMQRASTAEAGPRLWEGISGRVRPGEEPLDAARREVEEEAGLNVQIVERPIAVYAARRADEPMTVIVFLAQYAGGDLVLSSEHDAYRWCDAQTFSELGAPPQLVRLVRQHV